MRIQYGHFHRFGDIPYARWGTGDKVMLILSGGPGNIVSKGLGTRMMTGPFDAFSGEYTIYYLGRRRGHPAGHTTRDMAEDYVELIEGEFAGYVDVIAGMSYGGMIAQHLAVDYPDSFRRMIILMAAHRVSDPGKEIDRGLARLLIEGKKRQAASLLISAVYPGGLLRGLLKAGAWLMGPALFPGSGPAYRSDLKIEIEAECAHDTAERLPGLRVPVLLIGGTADVFFTPQILRETAGLMGEHVILRLYEGRAHGDLIEDKRFIPDVRAFIEEVI